MEVVGAPGDGAVAPGFEFLDEGGFGLGGDVVELGDTEECVGDEVGGVL